MNRICYNWVRFKVTPTLNSNNVAMKKFLLSSTLRGILGAIQESLIVEKTMRIVSHLRMQMVWIGKQNVKKPRIERNRWQVTSSFLLSYFWFATLGAWEGEFERKAMLGSPKRRAYKVRRYFNPTRATWLGLLVSWAALDFIRLSSFSCNIFFSYFLFWVWRKKIPVLIRAS